MKKEKTSISAIVYMLFSALFASFGQIFYKFASNRFYDVASFILNPYLYFGLGCYGVGLVFMLKALRRGELTVVYPVLATSFIWVGLLSPYFFNDAMSIQKWGGILMIIVGVTLIGRGRTR